MNKNSLDFSISQQILHHEKAIRSLDTLGSLILTGSLDKTCAFFDKDKDGKYNFIHESKLQDDYLYKVLTLKNKTGFLTAAKDKRIILIDCLGNPLKKLI